MKVLIVPVIAWAISQGLKQVFHLMGRNRRVFSGDTNPKILLSGGMPSAHSAIVVSLAVFLGLQDGWDSSIFGLATLRPTKAKEPNIIRVSMDKNRPFEPVKDWSRSFQYAFLFISVLQIINILWLRIDNNGLDTGVMHLNHPISYRS